MVRRIPDHICGCYFMLIGPHGWPEKTFLPQTELQSHTSITPVSFSTRLLQKFSNTQTKAIEEIRYCFPLYDGVSVGAYTIRYGDKQLSGVVKQKDEARKTYQEAVDRGETAGLLESLPAGTFGVTLGNVPAKTDIFVDIEYVGELKHDAGIDGLRYTLPTSICPRYGSYPGTLSHTPTINKDGIKITIDVDMGRSAIRKVQSLTHPIAVTMGNLSIESTSSTFSPSKGSATLSQGSAELGKDFVLQLLIDDISKPQAVIETHPTVDSRAIMTTLVPKFSMPASSPEIVFIADQSGSMMGTKNEQLKASLKIFLKSLPFSCRFNVCAFGSNYKYLWAESKAYNEANLKTASDFVDTLNAQYGGTEMFEPIKQAFLRRLGDLPLEVMVLTDGEIWQEEQLFEMINQYVHVEKVDARLFALGIGDDVSHTLVEGIARAGNGFAQFVVQEEVPDAKIVRMLKASLFPHTKDYTLEINYGESTEDDDFEFVEKVTNELRISDVSERPASKSSSSFFDESVDMDATTSSLDRYAHLPAVAIPKTLQAPTTITPLFPFNRSTAYIILGPDAPKKEVISITLRAQAPSGPLELTVPVTRTSGSTIHQLAAKKATQDLEEGRGWIQEGKTVDGFAVKEKHKSRLDELAEREAVRLGVTYQIANKWCSFVAVQDNSQAGNVNGEETIALPSMPMKTTRSRRGVPNASMFGGGGRGGSSLFGAPPPPAPSTRMSAAPSGGSLFGSAQPASYSRSMTTAYAPTSFGAPMPPPPPAPAPSGFGGGISSAAGGLFGGVLKKQKRSQPAAAPCAVQAEAEEDSETDDDMAFGLFDNGSQPTSEAALLQASGAKTATPADRLRAIISEQSFAGYWQWTAQLRGLLDTPNQAATMDDAQATALVLAYLQTRLPELKDVWDMVAEKALAWLEAQVGKERSDELQQQSKAALAA